MKAISATFGSGFTLVEMLVVLVVLGLVAGLVLTNGPPRSTTLDLRASANEIAAALRLARAQAIATDRPQVFLLDSGTHSYRVDGGMPHLLSQRLAVSITAVAGTTPAGATAGVIAGITFAPDGSSSGGRVEMTEAGGRMQVGVDWLTGRVSIAHAR